MKSTVDHFSHLSFFDAGVLFVSVLFFSIILTASGFSYAAELNPDSANLSTQTQEEFEYIVAHRKDPFVPFITEKAATADIDMSEIVDVEAELTGMQLFEPGQLSLVALMKSGDVDFAMVQDFTGKGYVISKGTKIGKRGVVIDITPNKVIIEETAHTRAGQKIVTNTVMVLKKEGEE